MAELRARLMAMPIEITVPDPVTGGDLTYKRDDIMRALIIDRTDLAGEACVVAGQYVEIARMERACRSASERAGTSYARWKADIADDFRRKSAGDKKPTEKQVEEAYRTHKDYERMAGLGAYYEQLGELFGDVKRAFDIKSRQIIALTGGQREHMGVERRGSGVQLPNDDKQTLAELDDFVARSIEQTRKEAAAPRKSAPVPPPPPLEDEEEAEPAPPAPAPKRTRKPARPVQVPIAPEPEDEPEKPADEDDIDLLDDEEEPPPRRPKGGKK
jgi:hypothetical protein